ncbi:2,3-diphosphoglycerate-dependent phosphoglycerate mutase [Enterococcus hirae]|nr:2,3-diphosphoglycerate-dependent phosphoglycerate mutase [Enterococcus hirae]
MKLALIRHGESETNNQNIFTGWLDPPLTQIGEQEALRAGKWIAAREIEFDRVFTSLQTRAIKSANLLLDAADRAFLPVMKTWRLNERHYGAVQGAEKQKIADKLGKMQVNAWRRGYVVSPPAIKHQKFDRRYQDLDPRLLPASESLADTLQRVLPVWENAIAPALKNRQNVLVVSHGNTLRALVKYLEEIPDEKINKLIIYSGEMILYEIDSDLEIKAKLSKRFDRPVDQ